MSEAQSHQPTLKRRWIRAGLGFLIGAAANVYLLRQSMGFLGAGHGQSPFGNLFFGPSELSLFLFPFVCAAAVSGWMPVVMVALLSEIAHHVATLDSLFQIPEVFHDRLRTDPDEIPILWQAYGIHFAAHLAILTVIGLEIYRWLNKGRGSLPQPSRAEGKA
jgi:hypothetical protein